MVDLTRTGHIPSRPGENREWMNVNVGLEETMKVGGRSRSRKKALRLLMNGQQVFILSR